MNTLLNGVHQRLADNRGLWSTTCGTATVALPAVATNIGSGAGLVDLASCIVPTYVSTMVMDPSTGTAADTIYSIVRDANGRITIGATGELTEVISVTR